MHIHRCMGSKTISLDDEAYGLLKSAKLADESFSDVLKRMLSPRRAKLTDLIGMMSADEGKALADTVEKMRREDRKSAQERHKRLWE